VSGDLGNVYLPASGSTGARFPNPYAPDSTVVLLNGVHTQGVVGATMAFSNYPAAMGNYSRVLKSVRPDSQGRRAFEAVFKVKVDPGNPMDAVKCPIVEKDNIFNIGLGRSAVFRINSRIVRQLSVAFNRVQS
jgi:hypothetical protein